MFMPTSSPDVLLPKNRNFMYRIMLRGCLCLAALYGLPANAQSNDQKAEADALLNEYLARSGLPGIAVAIGVKGELLYSGGFGYADVEQKVPIDPARTKFRIGSISKPLTSVAIGLLLQSGTLDLDAPIQAYVPVFPRKREGVITIRNLAGHLSGIRHYAGISEAFNQQNYSSILDTLSVFADDALLHAPGEKYGYSSYGFNLISAAIESISGGSYLDYMQQHVFQPLDMRNTVADKVDDIIPDKSRYYRIARGKIEKEDDYDASISWAGGGYLSTAEDLVKFGFSMLDNTLLTRATVDLLWTPQQLASGDMTRYGIGWQTLYANGTRYAFHSGDSPGGTVSLTIVESTGLVFVMASNTSFANLDVPLIQRLSRIFVPI
ncbi:MAG: serine hydrolase domain-containing protein [Pseudomonadales bacterium]|nr:serine hydrolase domain-containing protein [Pseudomonadales bacterium]